jgi:hypothetical protein
LAAPSRRCGVCLRECPVVRGPTRQRLARRPGASRRPGRRHCRQLERKGLLHRGRQRLGVRLRRCEVPRFARRPEHRRGRYRDRGRSRDRWVLARDHPGGHLRLWRSEPRLGRRLAADVVAIAAAPNGAGYWLVGATGAVEAFGVPSHGSLSHRPSSPVVGIDTNSAGRGYWIAEASGAILRFGGIASYGGVSGSSHSEPITAFSAVS